MDVEEPDRVALEPLSLRFVPLDVRQAGNAMSLQAPVQRRPRQVRDRRLQGVEAIVQRQQGMASKGNDRRFPGLGQNRRARLCRTGLHILDRRALAPLRDRLRVDPKFLAQLPRAKLAPLGIMLRMTLSGSGSLYCSSDGVRGRGAPVTNLSHNASFHSIERIAPSNRGIKHPGSRSCGAWDIEADCVAFGNSRCISTGCRPRCRVRRGAGRHRGPSPLPRRIL